MSEAQDCYSCARDAAAGSADPWEVIAADELWRVAHSYDSPLPGWLVLLPRRHVTAVADLTDAEATTLGLWQVRVSRALHAVLGCQKTYVVQFAESAAHTHVHFHLVPRSPDLPADLRGPRIFKLLGPDAGEPLRLDQRNELALAIRAQLAGKPAAGTAS